MTRAPGKMTMKRWAWMVAGLYCVILLVLTVPAILLAFVPEVGADRVVEIYGYGAYWLWLAVMVLGQFALLAVPVRFASRRPITRGALWPTVLAGGLMAGGLVFGAVCSVLETIFTEHGTGWWSWS